MGGPAKVIYYIGCKDWFYAKSNIQKVAVCMMKPYELIPSQDDHRSMVQTCDPNNTDSVTQTDRGTVNANGKQRHMLYLARYISYEGNIYVLYSDTTQFTCKC